MSPEKKAIRDLWLTYKLYGECQKVYKKDLDTSKYASECTDGFLEYLAECCKSYPKWKDNIEGVIRNQIRIYMGFVETYNKPIVKDKVTQKTRWSL